MDVRSANLIPRFATTPQHARALVALDGAALVSGIESVDHAIAYGYQMLGDRAVRVRTQFEATKATMDIEKPVVAAQPVDERGRKRDLGSYDKQQPAHNDGFAFGDFAPDHMFLYCEKPCSIGGANFLVDALRLASMLAEDDPEFASFLWDVPIDQSEPNVPQHNPAPIARMGAGGRVQVRSHQYFAPVLGPDEAAQWPSVKKWGEAVMLARAAGPRFRANAGDMICIDNYRMLHGRDGYVDVDRKMVSIWAWTTDAIAIPEGTLDIASPDMASLRRA